MKPDLRADYKIRLYTRPKNPFFEVSKLRLVRAMMQFRFTALVFDGIWYLPIGMGVKFHQIGDTCQVQPFRGQRQSHRAPHPAQLAAPALVDHGMQHVPFSGEPVLRPESFEMDQRSLAQAVDGVLNGRKRDGFLLRQKDHTRSRISTPNGKSVRSISIR